MEKPDLGQFSMSLNVKDVDVSVNFYDALGFKVVDGGHMNESFADTDSAKWRILQNEDTIIGLFQGMFSKNVMTFNPTDVRSVQKNLKANGVQLIKEVDEEGSGPESVMFQDPDGNQILLDQH